jgi:hypothetical protein
MAITPKEVAARLGVTPRQVRVVLRKLYRPNGENKNERWLLDDGMVREVERELGTRRRQ